MSGPRRCAFNGVAIFPEHVRISVAKPIDGLVDIADGIKPVRPAQQIHKLRLLPVGVLKFIHEHVLELMLNPFPHGFIFLEQARCLGDQ